MIGQLVKIGTKVTFKQTVIVMLMILTVLLGRIG